MSSSASSSPHHIVLTSSPDGLITAYDILSGTAIARFTGSRSPRHGLALAGKSFIAASHISSSANSGSIHLYNWWSSTALHHLPLPEPVAPIVATKDGLYLFAGGLSGTVYSLSLPSGDIVKYFSAHDKPVSCLKISDDGSLLITGGDDGAIVVLPIFQLVDASMDQDNSNKLLFQRFASHNDSVTDIIGLLNSSMLSCSRDCTCKLWTLTGIQLQTFTFPCAILGVALDPSETEFYAGGSDGLIYKVTMKVKTKQEISQRQKLVTTLPEKHGGAVVYVVMVNKGKHLLSASEDGSVFVWQAEREHMILVLGINDTASISSLVVAVNGIGDGNSGGAGGCSDVSGLSGRDMVSKSLRETMEVEDVLSEVGEDRSRAIDMLESAIGMYEKLLELIVKEAMKGSNNNTSSEKVKD